MKDDDVIRKIQSDLRNRGLYAGAIDGAWGPMSTAAWSMALAEMGAVPVRPVTSPAAPRHAGLTRIIWHWTAGGREASALDLEHYHFVITGSGKVVQGDHAPEANLSTADNDYAAHTCSANTGAIGIALAGMMNAVERPFDPGPVPITSRQVDALVTLTAELCQKYAIPTGRRTVLSHAEVQPTLGIAQRGKWDITWLPDRTQPGDPIAIGDTLRARVAPLL